MCQSLRLSLLRHPWEKRKNISLFDIESDDDVGPYVNVNPPIELVDLEKVDTVILIRLIWVKIPQPSFV